jgi:PBP1b-binding outer membrane lipoprotein LpoB
MKNFWFIVFSCLLLAGCGNGTYDKAMEQGKLALAQGEFEKAQGLFELALEEEPKDQEAQKYHDDLTALFEVEDAINNKEWDQALTKADQLQMEENLTNSIKKELEKHRRTAENAKNDQQNDTEEKQAEEESSEEKKDAISWKTYHNERFGFTINYPEEWTPAPEPTNGDGRALVSGNENEVLVYASNYMTENHPDLTGYEKVITASDYEGFIRDDQDSSFEGVIIHEGIEFHLSATMSPSFKEKYYEAIKQMFHDVKFE